MSSMGPLSTTTSARAGGEPTLSKTCPPWNRVLVILTSRGLEAGAICAAPVMVCYDRMRTWVAEREPVLVAPRRAIVVCTSAARSSAAFCTPRSPPAMRP